jgi:hypothetical protein
VIRSNGFVGVGLTSGVVALAPLHVQNTDVLTGQLILGSQRVNIASGSVIGGVEFWSNDAGLADPGALSGYFRCRAISAHTGTDLGSELVWGLTPLGTATPIEAMRLTYLGSLVVGTTTAGASATNALALGQGSGPTNTPTDAAQAWVEDLNGVAGTTAWHFRSEDGVITRIGNGLYTRLPVISGTTWTEAAPYVLTAEESNALLASNNASAKAQVNLPSAVAGLVYTVCLYSGASGVRVRAFTGDFIRVAGVGQSTTAGYVETTTLYGSITLVAVNPSQWMAVAMIGTWTVG